MEVRLATIGDRALWDGFVVNNPHGSFMQSWAWGDMQQQFGMACQRVLLEDATGVRGVSLVLTRDLPFGKSWLYVPRGPVFDQLVSRNVVREWRTFMQRLAYETGAVFIRSDPLVSDTQSDVLFQEAQWQKADHEVQPRHTLFIDVSRDPEDLLVEMHHKTRYNIRLAERRGVTVRFSTARRDLDAFLRLAQEVKNRGPFRFHPNAYYEAMHTVLVGAKLLSYGVAEYQGEVLAVHLLLAFGTTVTYIHGASSSEQRSVMAPQLLQWESLKRAHAQGFSNYDFFGVAASDATPDHPWSGITRFKEGFGGTRQDYIGAYDYVLDDRWYRLFGLARRVRQLL